MHQRRVLSINALLIGSWVAQLHIILVPSKHSTVHLGYPMDVC